MSIGPKTKQDQGIRVSFADKTKFIAKETLKTFFLDPTHYLFYGALSFTIIGLLLGRSFQWPLYVILVLLGIFKFTTQTKK